MVSIPFLVAQNTRIGLPTEYCCRVENNFESRDFANWKSLISILPWNAHDVPRQLAWAVIITELIINEPGIIVYLAYHQTSKTVAGSCCPTPLPIHSATSLDIWNSSRYQNETDSRLSSTSF
jgi:hypothetical protein